eukprot:241316_1
MDSLRREIKDHYDSNSETPILRFMYGGPGTGKSYIIRCIKQTLGDCCAVSGTTGVASFNICGPCIYGLAQLPVGGYNRKQLSGASLQRLQAKFEGVRYLIVDEVSMLGQDTLEWLDKRLKQATGKQSALFGGLSIVLVGDFKQLPPVGDTPLWVNPGRRDPTGFNLFRQFTPYWLDLVIRQKKDKVFMELLRKLPDGKINDREYELLCARDPSKLDLNL